jgi:hypothetical protein
MSINPQKIADKLNCRFLNLSILFRTENQYTRPQWRKYNGKSSERSGDPGRSTRKKQTGFDLNWSDYGARMPARQKYCRKQNWGMMRQLGGGLWLTHSPKPFKINPLIFTYKQSGSVI